MNSYITWECTCTKPRWQRGCPRYCGNGFETARPVPPLYRSSRIDRSPAGDVMATSLGAVTPMRLALPDELPSAVRRLVTFCESKGVPVRVTYACGYPPDSRMLVESIALRTPHVVAVWENGTAWRAWAMSYSTNGGAIERVPFTRLRKIIEERIGA